MKTPFSSYSAPLPGYGTSLIDRINIYLHFRRYFKIVTERWLLLATFTVVGTGIGVWLAVTKPSTYRSTTTLVTPQKIGGPKDTMQDGGMSVDSVLTLMIQEAVIQRVLGKLQEGRDNTNKLVRPQLSARAGSGGTFIMEVVSTNYDYARQFAGAWGQEFIDFAKQQRRNQIGNSEAQTTSMILTFQRKWELAQQALDDFQKKNNIASIEDAGISAQRNLDRKKGDYEQLVTAQKLYENASAEQLATSGGLGIGASQRPAASGEKASIKNTRNDDPGETADPNNDRFSGGSRYPELIREVRSRERQLALWSEKLQDKHPYMLELRRQIQEMQGRIKDDLELVDKARKAHVESLRQQAQGYPKLIDELTAEVFESTGLRIEFVRLQQEEARYKQQLDDLNTQLVQMGKYGIDEEQFQMISPGTGSPTPVGPNRPYIIGSGAGIGFVLAAAIIFILHRLDDRLESPEDIEAKLEEPILGQLPEVDKKHYTEGYLLLSRMKAHTMFAESLRGVRSSLLLSPEGSSKRMLAVTSAVPGDGKTTFTANFAITLANAGNKTLLIDADLRRGNVHGYFEQPLEGGLAEVLQGKLSIKDATRETGINNLYFIRAGERPSNPSELLIGPSTKELVKDLRAEFDYVIFDCPPLTAIDDTFSIAAFLDGLFFVVRAGRTSIRFAKMGINTIHQRGAPILGLIVNGVPIDNPYYYYTTYYYASYYHRPLTPDQSIYPDAKRQAAAELPAKVESKRVIDVAPAEKPADTDGVKPPLPPT